MNLVKGKVRSVKKIRENWQDILDEDVQSIASYMRSSPISVVDGGVLSEFEREFAKFVGAKFAVAFCNGTAALHAASFACGANRESKFILPSYSFFGTVNSVLENGSKVDLCDYDPDSLGINVKSAEKIIDESTVGLIVTHCFGNPVDMDGIAKLKEKYPLKIISDASHAHGAKWNNQYIGSLACEDVTCFSLGKGKLISCGELGVAVTNDEFIYDSLLFLGHSNRVPGAFITKKYDGYKNCIGNKYRPHALSLPLALNQIRRFPEKLKKNLSTNEYLINRISRIPGFKCCKTYAYAKRVYWKLIVLLDRDYWKDIELRKVVYSLEKEGVPLEQWHNYNIKDHEYIWNHERYRGQVENKSSVKSSDNVLVLPGYVDISQDDMNFIIKGFEKVSQDRRKII